MKVLLSWKKNLFSDLYTIYENNLQIGTLRGNSFSQSAYSELYGKSYTFKTKGFLRQHTEIIEEPTQTVIGIITLDNLWTKANIKLHGKEVHWKYENLSNTKWRVSDETGLSIKYATSLTTGRIESNSMDLPLLLAGLFVTNYYWKMSLVIFIVLIIGIIR
ncbi:hypothetical protein [Niabella beijingensis]|uniref:hypothetical protein n=1 Tax=Niabella beijingensis TaxID=2872700 RepID=UPI001CC10273|nr:hypothetical protein [Niabella beijingensis]MBZ4192270.1 hypothetical protein [Niabella beijingensis]